MGWSPGDDIRVNLARIQLSAVKSALYRPMHDLTMTITRIVHNDKREMLLARCVAVQREIDDIERQLHS